MPKLSDAFVRQLESQDLETVYDTEVPGFGVRVRSSGLKSFVLRYRNEHGRDRLLTIGRFDVWTTGPARTEAKRLLREEVNIGIDPLGDRKAKRAELTVNDMLDRYVKSARFESKGEFTQYVDLGRLNRHVRPLLGKRMLGELTLDMVERAFSDIASGKTAVGKVKTKKFGLARVTGGEGTARKAIQLFRASLSWAVREKLLASNPAIGAELGRDGVRKLLLDPAQYRTLFETLDKLEGNGEGKVLAKHADAIRLIAMTGARRGEICGLRREHVDLNAGLIVLPPTGHKTGKTTGEERIIGLPDEAIEIIQRQPEGEVVFPIDPAKLTAAWVLVRTAARLPSNFGLHGLRHSVASHLAMDGAGAAEIMTALGHKRIETSQRYIHWQQSARATLAKRAAGPALAGLSASRAAR